MKPKQYQVNTLQDMIDCTNEDNLDNFLKDLKGIITSAHLFQNLSDSILEDSGFDKELNKLETDGFIWIDDNKHNINIELKTKEE